MGYFIRRLLLTLPTLLGVITFAFLLIRVAPGDPAQLMLGDLAAINPEEIVQDFREKFGLDRPLHEQYLKYVLSVLRGDLGRSFRNGRLVFSEILSMLPYTIHLALGGVILAVVIGVPAGTFIAFHRNRLSDYLVSSLSVLWLSVPSFWLGLLLIYFFSYRLGWFPVFGAGESGSWASLIRSLVLPALAVGARSAALVARMTRSSVLDVLSQDYVRTAWAKGLPARIVVSKHVLRNAGMNIVTVVGLDLAYLLGGAVVVETVFARPGLGKLVVDAIYARDYPTVQGAVIFFALVILAVNLIVDLVYALMNPRIRYSE